MKKLILGLLLFFGVAKAETTFDAYDFYVEHLPAVCGTSTQIKQYADEFLDIEQEEAALKERVVELGKRKNQLQYDLIPALLKDADVEKIRIDNQGLLDDGSGDNQ